MPVCVGICSGDLLHSLAVATAVGAGLFVCRKLVSLLNTAFAKGSQALNEAAANLTSQTWRCDKSVDVSDEINRTEATLRSGLLVEDSVRYDVTLWLKAGSTYRGEVNVRFRCSTDCFDSFAGGTRRFSHFEQTRGLSSNRAQLFINFSGGYIDYFSINGQVIGGDGYPVQSAACGRYPFRRVEDVVAAPRAPSEVSNWNAHKIFLANSLLNLRGKTNKVTIRYTNDYDRCGIGLHQFVDPVNGDDYWHINLQGFEAHRIFPCFDQPDILGFLRLTVVAPSSAIVFSNSVPLPAPTAGTTRDSSARDSGCRVRRVNLHNGTTTNRRARRPTRDESCETHARSSRRTILDDVPKGMYRVWNFNPPFRIGTAGLFFAAGPFLFVDNYLPLVSFRPSTLTPSNHPSNPSVPSPPVLPRLSPWSTLGRRRTLHATIYFRKTIDKNFDTVVSRKL